jgi:hypothetical protein
VSKAPNYLIGKIEAPDGCCRVKGLQNVDDSFELSFGFSRSAGFPADASFRMNDEFPKDLTLTDFLHNQECLVVASARLREFLESVPGALFQNEVLPVKIINHKGRREKAPYFIISQLRHPSCLDEKACVGKKFAVNPDHFRSMKKLVLDESLIDPKLMIFRVAEYNVIPFFRRDLATKLREQKFTGIAFHEIQGFDFS